MLRAPTRPTGHAHQCMMLQIRTPYRDPPASRLQLSADFMHFGRPGVSTPLPPRGGLPETQHTLGRAPSFSLWFRSNGEVRPAAAQRRRRSAWGAGWDAGGCRGRDRHSKHPMGPPQQPRSASTAANPPNSCLWDAHGRPVHTPGVFQPGKEEVHHDADDDEDVGGEEVGQGAVRNVGRCRQVYQGGDSADRAAHGLTCARDQKTRAQHLGPSQPDRDGHS